jgi:Domain of unknown function (DUF4406)
MKVVYVAGKYSGPTHDARSYTDIERNILFAREYAIKIMALGEVVTLVPHLNSYHMELDFTTSQDFWYKADLELLSRCDAIFMLPNWLDSKGAKIEELYAREHSIPVFYELPILQKWLIEPVSP